MSSNLKESIQGPEKFFSKFTIQSKSHDVLVNEHTVSTEDWEFRGTTNRDEQVLGTLPGVQVG